MSTLQIWQALQGRCHTFDWLASKTISASETSDANACFTFFCCNLFSFFVFPHQPGRQQQYFKTCNPQPATVVRPAELELFIHPAAVRAAELAAGQWRLQCPPGEAQKQHPAISTYPCSHHFTLGGWLLSLQTDRCSFDPTERALIQRSVQPLPEHLRGQLQGAPAGCDQGCPRLEHRSQKDLGRVFDPARGGCWNRTESLCSRLPAALLPGQQGLH